MNPFDLIKTFFSEEYRKVSNIDKRNNSFMINNRFSIKFPIQAATLSHFKIPAIYLVDFWKYITKKNFKEYPLFLYTKSAKKINNIEFSIEDSKLYCNRYKCSIKDFNYLSKTNPKELAKELKNLKEILDGGISK